jgi:hypothetical protein
MVSMIDSIVVAYIYIYTSNTIYNAITWYNPLYIYIYTYPKKTFVFAFLACFVPWDTKNGVFLISTFDMLIYIYIYITKA